MPLFQWGSFELHSGERSFWRIDCDALTDSELALIAKMILEKSGPVEFVTAPTSHPGSAVLKLKQHCHDLIDPNFMPGRGRCLIIDDVLTTGASMEECRNSMEWHGARGYSFVGVVVFARGKCPEWVTPIFQYIN